MTRPIETPLSRLRLDRGLTQTQLAEAAGVDVAAIHRAESARRPPRYEVIVKVAHALGMHPVDYFAAVHETWWGREVTASEVTAGSDCTGVGSVACREVA